MSSPRRLFALALVVLGAVAFGVAYLDGRAAEAGLVGSRDGLTAMLLGAALCLSGWIGLRPREGRVYSLATVGAGFVCLVLGVVTLATGGERLHGAFLVLGGVIMLGMSRALATLDAPDERR